MEKREKQTETINVRTTKSYKKRFKQLCKDHNVSQRIMIENMIDKEKKEVLK